MKAKEEGMGKELSIGLEDTLLSLSLNPFLLYHEFSFKELKLFLDLYASYVTLVGNMMEFMWLLFCGKKMNGSLTVLKVHPCDLVKTTFENSVFELALEELDQKLVAKLVNLRCKESKISLSPKVPLRRKASLVSRAPIRNF
ncbi:hypothetical protein M9H77_02191 [Catharanthus roseus]|uniref:Uncharacterized protein n=1 Tax=Catharanthus roseus TaxID=4058 RepID=A0ACC0C7T9_CATRO|nr:hypothetical protein M9H77_02191 [Catharanthus roseus]